MVIIDSGVRDYMQLFWFKLYVKLLLNAQLGLLYSNSLQSCQSTSRITLVSS